MAACISWANLATLPPEKRNLFLHEYAHHQLFGLSGGTGSVSNVGSGVLALNVPPPSSKVAKHGQSGWIITRQVRGKHCFWVEP